jgi:hypothetical protein
MEGGNAVEGYQEVHGNSVHFIRGRTWAMVA